MKILKGHCYYGQIGGEDVTFDEENALLKRMGEEVIPFVKDNEVLFEGGARALAGAAVDAVWARGARRELLALLKRERPDVAHFANTFPLMSPSVYGACTEVSVPVVQTLSNFRLVCPRADLFRNGGPCEDCIGTRTEWPGVLHGCYRNSRATTAVVALMSGVHRTIGTFRHQVDAFIVPSEFAASRLSVRIPRERIHVVPSAVNSATDTTAPGDFALFVGRLTIEKGAHVLAAALREGTGMNVRVVGDGPLLPALASTPHSECLGVLPHGEVVDLIRRSAVVVVPSVSYESFGRACVEAFACGRPVIASDIGALNEVVEAGVTGLLVPPNDVTALREALRWAAARPSEIERMGRQAKRVFESRYSQDRQYERLMRVYSAVVA